MKTTVSNILRHKYGEIGEKMEQYIISKLAIAKAQLEVDLLECQWKLEQANLRIKELEETKGSDE